MWLLILRTLHNLLKLTFKEVDGRFKTNSWPKELTIKANEIVKMISYSWWGSLFQLLRSIITDAWWWHFTFSRKKQQWNHYFAILGRICHKSIILGIVRRSVDQMDPLVTSDSQQHFRRFLNFLKKSGKNCLTTRAKEMKPKINVFFSLCRTFIYLTINKF